MTVTITTMMTMTLMRIMMTITIPITMIFLDVYPPIHPSIHPFLYPGFHPFLHPFTYLSTGRVRVQLCHLARHWALEHVSGILQFQNYFSVRPPACNSVVSPALSGRGRQRGCRARQGVGLFKLSNGGPLPFAAMAHVSGAVVERLGVPREAHSAFRHVSLVFC